MWKEFKSQVIALPLVYKMDTSVHQTPRVGPSFLYSLYLTLCQTDTSVKQTSRVAPTPFI